MFHKIGLILEGGGMRGAYTSGVLDVLMDENIKFSYIIGVSAGASNGASFVSEQRGRNRKVFVDYVLDKRYKSFRNLVKEHSYFGMDFLFNQLPNIIEPFDYHTFNESPVNFKVGLTDCETGQPVYLKCDNFDPHFYVQYVLRASSSLPFISPSVKIHGREYLDGGISDSIPISKSMEDGNRYNVVILTRNEDYRKKPLKFNPLLRILSLKYPKLFMSLKNRYLKYNSCLEKINQLEQEGLVFVFRPVKKISVKRLENDITKLQNLYDQGYHETLLKMNKFKEWLKSVNINIREGLK